jgi:hypothetical protein
MNLPTVAFNDEEIAVMRESMDASVARGRGLQMNYGPYQLTRTRPFFLSILGGADGRIYLTGFDPARRYTRDNLFEVVDEGGQAIDVLEPSGRYVGRLRTDTATVLLPGYGDNVLLLRRVNDAPQVARGVIVWPASRQ